MFDFEVFHVPGINMVNADFLSLNNLLPATPSEVSEAAVLEKKSPLPFPLDQLQRDINVLHGSPRRGQQSPGGQQQVRACEGDDFERFLPHEPQQGVPPARSHRTVAQGQ